MIAQIRKTDYTDKTSTLICVIASKICVINLKRKDFTLPQRRNAIKALRINKKRRLHNLDIKTELRKTVKTFQSLVNQKKREEAKALLKTLYKKIDKAAKRHLLHKNTASRRKSTFSRLLSRIA